MEQCINGCILQDRQLFEEIMPKLSGPQELIKLTQGILSAQYCQYIYGSIEENLHEKLEQGFSGFLNDVSNEPSKTLSPLDLVHTDIVSLLDVLYSLQTAPTQDALEDCIHYFKTLESVLPNMSAKILHIAYHLNQYLSEEMGILDAAEIMKLFKKHGYPQQHIDIKNWETCVECNCSNKLDQAMVILLRMANDIPSPSFSWVFESENCKVFLQEVQRLYTFRRTFESANSFQEHNYSFLHANSNRCPKYAPQDDVHISDNLSDLPRRLSQQENDLRSKLFTEWPKGEGVDGSRNHECRPRTSVDELRKNCDKLNVESVRAPPTKTLDSRVESAGVNLSPSVSAVDVNTQTEFTSESDCESLDSFHSGVVERRRIVSTKFRSSRSTSSGSPVRDEYATACDTTSESPFLSVEEAEENNEGSFTLLNKEVSSSLEKVIQAVEKIHSDSESEVSFDLETVFSSDVPNAAALTQRSPRKGTPNDSKRQPKRMLVVLVERLNMDKWISENSIDNTGELEDDDESLQELSLHEDTLILPASSETKNCTEKDEVTVLRRRRRASLCDPSEYLNPQTRRRTRRLSEPTLPSYQFHKSHGELENVSQSLCAEASTSCKESNVSQNANSERWLFISDSEDFSLDVNSSARIDQNNNSNNASLDEPEVREERTLDESGSNKNEEDEPRSQSNVDSVESNTTLIEDTSETCRKDSKSGSPKRDDPEEEGFQYFTRSRRTSQQTPRQPFKSVSKKKVCSTEIKRQPFRTLRNTVNVPEENTIAASSDSSTETEQDSTSGAEAETDLSNWSPGKDGISSSDGECDDARADSNKKRPIEATTLPCATVKESDEKWLTVPAKRCRTNFPPVNDSEDKGEFSPHSLSSRVSSLSSTTSCSTEQSTRVKHKLYTGAADKIMAISRRRLVEDSLLLDTEIKSGPKAQRAQRVVKL